MIGLIEAIRLNDGTNFMHQNFINGRCEERDLTRLTRVFKKMQFNVRYAGEDQVSRRIELRSFDSSTANSHHIDELSKSVAQYFAEKVRFRSTVNRLIAHLAFSTGSRWSTRTRTWSA